MSLAGRPWRFALLLLLFALLGAACGPQFDREQVYIDAGGVTPAGSDPGAALPLASSPVGAATAATGFPADSQAGGAAAADGGVTPSATATGSQATEGSGAGRTGSAASTSTGQDGGGATASPGEPAAGAASGEAQSGAPGPQPGITDDTIKVGYLVPLTGAAPIPQSWDQGARLYWDNHEVNGRKVEVIIEDTESSTTTAVAKARKLVTEDKVFTILSLDRLEVQDAIARELEARNFPHIMVQSPTPPPADWTNTFTISIDHTVQGRSIARFFASELADIGNEVAVVREQTNALKPGTDAFVAEAGAQGLDVVANETINPSQADYTGTVLRLQQSGAKIVWLYMAPTVAARIISQSGAQGYHPTWFANSISWNFELMHGVTQGNMEGAYAFSPWVALSDPRTQEYKAAWSACSDCTGAADDIGLVGWAAGGVLDAALSAPAVLGHDSFRSSMRTFRANTGLWAPIDFSAGGSVGSSQVAVFKSVGGAWQMAGDFRGF